MSQRPIMDAGPGINFLSVNKEGLLFSTLGALSVPEAVQTEILRKAGQDERFAAAGRVWKKLPESLMEVLSDDVTDELSAAVQRTSGIPLDRRFAPGRTSARRWSSPMPPWQPKPGNMSSSSSTTAGDTVLPRQKPDGCNGSKRLRRTQC